MDIYSIMQLATQSVAIIAIYDIWFYLTHVLLHTKYFYNRIHYIHHQTPYQKLQWYHTYVSHIVEDTLQYGAFAIPPFFYETPWKNANFWIAMMCAASVCTVRGLARHDHRAKWLVGDHHLLHHKYPESNYSEWWVDYLCGTLYVTPPPIPGKSVEYRQY
jgi:sterol desaturase/sphingolipid hydroxylase (fatty acid hydroxylase superfamily)